MKQSLETLLLLMKKTRSKKFKVRMFLAWEVFVRGLCRGGGVCPGFFVLSPFNFNFVPKQVVVESPLCVAM